MRIVVATYPDRAHFFSMVPTAWALRAAGHEVRIATRPSMTGTAAETGLTVMPLGEGGDEVSECAGGRSFDPESTGWWQEVDEPLVEDLVAFCREWGPDLVLWEASTHAGAIAAEVVGAAHGRFLGGWDPLVHGEGTVGENFSGTPREWLEEKASQFGISFSDSLLLGHFSVHQLPESVYPSGSGKAGRRLPVRPVPYRGAASLPSWARGEPVGTRILVDWSSWDRSARGAQVLAETVADLDTEVVVLCPAGREEELPPLPEEVLVVDSAATPLLLTSASLVIHGGGFDLVCAAAVHALPHVVVLNPRFADAAALMNPLMERGCAVSLTLTEALEGALPEAVSRMLAGADGSAVEALRKEMETVPAPGELVSELEELTGLFRVL